jgi:hypothetical protein
MGFLNHSTNNIIIDAVLTEKGRELLARSDRSFEITSFKLSDDEVDYSLITKYGKIIGKEKIEKNTPIFEALTGEDTSIKYPLLNITNVNNLLYIPKIVNTAEVNSVTISSNSNQNNYQQTLNFKTSITGVTSNFVLTQKLVDDKYFIVMNKNLLSLSDGKGTVQKEHEEIIVYSVDVVTNNNNKEYSGQRFGSIVLQVSGDFTTDLFSLYSDSDNNIITEVNVIGNRSGATLVVPVKITLN